MKRLCLEEEGVKQWYKNTTKRSNSLRLYIFACGTPLVIIKLSTELNLYFINILLDVRYSMLANVGHRILLSVGIESLQSY